MILMICEDDSYFDKVENVKFGMLPSCKVVICEDDMYVHAVMMVMMIIITMIIFDDNRHGIGEDDMLNYPLLHPTETTVVRFSTRSNLWIVKTLRLSDAVAGTIREMVCQCQVGLSLHLTSHCSIYSLAIKTKKATKFQLWGKPRKGVSSWKPLNISSGGLWMVANPKCRRQT